MHGNGADDAGGLGPPHGDDQPAGDPRDPRGDLRRPARGASRRVPRWATVLLALLVLAPLITHRQVLLADPGMTLEALGFAAAVCVPLVVGLLWADRRWPADRDRSSNT